MLDKYWNRHSLFDVYKVKTKRDNKKKNTPMQKGFISYMNCVPTKIYIYYIVQTDGCFFCVKT